MAVQLDATKIAAPAISQNAPGEYAGDVSTKLESVLGGENLKVTTALTTDLDKLVEQLKNENAATRQSIAQRRAAILSTVLDSMADRISQAEKENLLKLDQLNTQKAEATANLSSLRLQQTTMQALIDSLDQQIQQAVKDGEDHREKVAELKRQRAEQQEKLDAVKKSIESVTSKIAGLDADIENCSKAIASSTLNEVYAALRAAVGDENLEAEAIESQADRDRQEAKSLATDIALHISAALDKLDGQIRAALDEAQMKVEG